MSFQAMAAALSVKGLSPAEKLVLLMLANYADEHMTCWPSQAKLCEDTEMSPRSMVRVLASLEGKGLITRTARRRENGSRTSDLVTLSLTAKLAPDNLPNWHHPPAKLAPPEPITEPTDSSLRSESGARARFCPSSWYPKPATIDVAEAEGFSIGEIERELARMKDHEFNRPYSDWDRVFRNWIRKARDLKPASKPNVVQMLDLVDQYADRLDSLQGGGLPRYGQTARG